MASKFHKRVEHVVWLTRHHWRTRMTYCRTLDWFCSIYSDLILLVRGVRWPGRRVVRTVYSPFLDGPTFLRVGTSDWGMFEQLLCDGEYAPLFEHNPSGIRVILDLGANIGLSVRLWQRAFPGSTITAVEPDPENLAAARRNGGSAVHFIQAGAGAQAGKFFLDQVGSECSYKVRETPADSNAISVDVLTVPQILETANIKGDVDFLKCDIEGSEIALFKNCASWIKRVRNLAVELHPPYTSEEFLSDLQGAGSELAEYGRVDRGQYKVLFLERSNENGSPNPQSN